GQQRLEAGRVADVGRATRRGGRRGRCERGRGRRAGGARADAHGDLAADVVVGGARVREQADRARVLVGRRGRQVQVVVQLFQGPVPERRRRAPRRRGRGGRRRRDRHPPRTWGASGQAQIVFVFAGA